VWHIINILYREYSFAKVGAASGQSIPGAIGFMVGTIPDGTDY